MKKNLLLAGLVLISSVSSAKDYTHHKCWVTTVDGEELIVFAAFKSGKDNGLAKHLLEDVGVAKTLDNTYMLSEVHECTLESKTFISPKAKLLDLKTPQ